jgi:hypothetical protein
MATAPNTVVVPISSGGMAAVPYVTHSSLFDRSLPLYVASDVT